MNSEIISRTKSFNLAGWLSQDAWTPISVERGQGVYFWDDTGKRYLDWLSGIFNVNIGHAHPRVVRAIQEQAARITYVNPKMTTEPRARLAEMLAELTPGDLTKTFFTTGGGEANENAMKIARQFSGRQKILTRYRSYHGATMGASTATGDPRRLPSEPGVPWVVHLPDPDAYHSPVYRGRTQEEGDLVIAEMIEEVIHFEGPQNCAAILWESYSGANGIIQPTAAFFTRLSEICQKYGILFIADEVLSGFGRTGAWFGINHYPDVKVDMMTLAKGINSGYVPLGGVIVSQEIADYFNARAVSTGLTNHGHPLACAAGVANIEVLRDENLVENARVMGEALRSGLVRLAEKHPVIGDIRGTGLHQVIELVADRETRQLLSGFNQPLSEPMELFSRVLIEEGMHTMVRWNMVFSCPPLIISEEQLHEGLAILDRALSRIDPYYTGSH